MTRVLPSSWFRVALRLLALAALPAITMAADRLHWQAGRDAELIDAFSSQWQATRGRAPVLLDNPIDTVLTVARYAKDARKPGITSPVVFLQVPRQATAPNRWESGIYAEPNVDALLALWQQLLPNRRPAGLLVGAGSRSLWPIWRQAAMRQGLSLQPGFVRPGEQAQRIFNLIRPSIAVLIYSTEMATDDAVALTVILRESLSSGLPVFGADPNLLPAGAFAVLYQSQAARGKQAALLALRLLQGNSPGWQEPNDLHYDINQQVVRTLQLPLDAVDQHNKATPVEKTTDNTP